MRVRKWIKECSALIWFLFVILILFPLPIGASILLTKFLLKDNVRVASWPIILIFAFIALVALMIIGSVIEDIAEKVYSTKFVALFFGTFLGWSLLSLMLLFVVQPLLGAMVAGFFSYILGSALFMLLKPLWRRMETNIVKNGRRDEPEHGDERA